MNQISLTEEVWVISDKSREIVATGSPRNRCLTKISNVKKQRILTYSHKGVAEAAFKKWGFYNETGVPTEAIELEAVKCERAIIEKLEK